MPAGNDVPGSRNLSFSTKATETGLTEPTVYLFKIKQIRELLYIFMWMVVEAFHKNI